MPGCEKVTFKNIKIKLEAVTLMWESDKRTANMNWTLNFCQSVPQQEQSAGAIGEGAKEKVFNSKSFADLLKPPSEIDTSLDSKESQDQQRNPPDELIPVDDE